jgi:hypothetical protein
MTNPNLIGTLYKVHDEVFQVSVDFSSWLDADTISTSAVKCYYGSTDTSTTMIASVADDDDDHVTFTVRAGTSGQTYLIEATVTTAGGDTWLAQLNLVVN